MVLVVALALPGARVSGQGRLQKEAAAIESKYTTVGSIALTVTNLGILGTANAFWPNQPSCEFPRGSGIEHIYQGGLWVGGLMRTHDPNDSRNGQIYVTTATSDRAVASSRSSHLITGFEFNPEAGDSITEISSLRTNRPSTSQFSLASISHQDFIADYNDFHTRDPVTRDSLADHTPLGLRIHQESYAWNFPFVNFFVVVSYTITNASADTLDSVYVGFWNNATVRNTNLVHPGTPGYFNYTGQGFDSTQRLAYSFDFNGVPGGPPADSYVGVKLLGTTPFPSGADSLGDLLRRTYYNAWLYRTSDPNYGAFISPTDDYNTDPLLSRYSRMTQSMSPSDIAQLRVVPQNASYLLSTGPFSRLNPGDSVQVVYAVVCAKKNGSAPAGNDSPDQRSTLYSNIAWAQRVYNGEDVNGNDRLDPDEDIATRSPFGILYTPDGQITRYLLPTPPKQPRARAVVENRDVALYWDKATSEESVDPITGLKDFEGYRIYRSNEGSDFLSHENFTVAVPLVGEFDKADDSVGYNTGFGKILLPSPRIFPGDTTQYWYRFPPSGVASSSLNGWQYLYGVSAFSKADSSHNIPSLESAPSVSRVVPGTPATSEPSAVVGVYPNPYYAHAYWDGSSERLRKIYFYNLPARCKITIFTLAGGVIQIIDHDASTYNGGDIQWFTQFGDPSTRAQFSGGEHAWDLITRYDQAIATGLYLFTVEDNATGAVKKGKFLIVK